MAKKKVNEPLSIEAAEPNLRTLKNGAVYDMDRHRIVDASNITTKITSANARELQTLAIAKKREAVRSAAQAAVLRGDLVAAYGDQAWIAEITQAQMMLATSPDAGKAAIMAADWLIRNAGVDEKLDKNDGPQNEPPSQTLDAVSDLIRLINDTIQAKIHETPQAVDGKVVETRQRPDSPLSVDGDKL